MIRKIYENPLAKVALVHTRRAIAASLGGSTTGLGVEISPGGEGGDGTGVSSDLGEEVEGIW